MATLPLERTADIVKLDSFPSAPWAVPSSTISAGRYIMRFARTEEELARIQRLRYSVYNVELQEGLASSHATQRDEDRFDAGFHHLLIEERSTAEIIGTYRMQTGEMAAEQGWYSAGLFDVDALPEAARSKAVELGRACIAKAHRNGRVLDLLWRGLASYLTWNKKSVLFGGCSINSQNTAEGSALHQHLTRLGALHERYRVEPRPEHRCEESGPAPVPGPTPRIPSLFQAYLTLGARALGSPAIDREFRTIDWLMLLDIADLDGVTYRAFFR